MMRYLYQLSPIRAQMVQEGHRSGRYTLSFPRNLYIVPELTQVYKRLVSYGSVIRFPITESDDPYHRGPWDQISTPERADWVMISSGALFILGSFRVLDSSLPATQALAVS